MSVISNAMEEELGVNVLCETYSATIDISSIHDLDKLFIKDTLEERGFKVTVEKEDILSISLVQEL